MKIIISLFFLVALSIHVNAEDVSTDKKDQRLLPTKILSVIPTGKSEISFEYDSLLRVSNVTTLFFETYNTVARTEKINIFYDDESPLNKSGKFCVVRAVGKITTDNYSPKVTTEYIYFTTKEITPDTIEIETENDLSVKRYLVDAKSGRLLETKVYSKKNGGDSLAYSASVSYNLDGNVNKYSLSGSYNKTNSSLVEVTYDNQNAPFIHTKTPRWFLNEYVFNLSLFNQVNNVTYFEFRGDEDNCISKVKVDYDHNDEGYPVRCLYMTENEDYYPKCTISGDFQYIFEYMPVNFITGK